MSGVLQRLVVPGLVIQAVMVGGGYATGRELVEFFISEGPANGLAGMALTATFFSITAMICFELARRFNAFDYRSFCKIYLGRFWFLFEFGYLATLLVSLSVVSAGAASLIGESVGTPHLLNALIFMVMVAALVFFGNTVIERVISAWSILFYIAYGAMFLFVVNRIGGDIAGALAAKPIAPDRVVVSSLSYTGYNIVLIPIMIFIARNFRSRSEALISGMLAGPLILLPGLAFLLTLSAFYPSILSETLPVTTVLGFLDIGWLTVTIQVVILGALIKTGAGLLHGLNERLAVAAAETGRVLPSAARSAIALVAMLFAAFAASAIGLIDLIKHGFRFSSYYFLLVFLLPLFTRGLWLLLKAR